MNDRNFLCDPHSSPNPFSSFSVLSPKNFHFKTFDYKQQSCSSSEHQLQQAPTTPKLQCQLRWALTSSEIQQPASTPEEPSLDKESLKNMLDPKVEGNLVIFSLDFGIPSLQLVLFSLLRFFFFSRRYKQAIFHLISANMVWYKNHIGW